MHDMTSLAPPRTGADAVPPAPDGGPRVSFLIGGTVCLVVAAGEEGPGDGAECVGHLELHARRYRVLAVPAEPPAPCLLDLLTPRELEIALLVASGQDCKSAARQLRISFHTVRVHMGRIYCKLGLHKQTELASLISSRLGTQLPPGGG